MDIYGTVIDTASHSQPYALYDPNAARRLPRATCGAEYTDLAIPGWHEYLDLGMIREIKSGQLLTARQLAERLAAASHVLVGEQHDNPDHHALQLWLLQALADYRAQGSLLLETLASSQQASVDALQAGMTTSNYPADLAAALKWQPAWDWLMFGPILRFVLAQPYRVLAANLDPGQPENLPEHMARCVLAAPVPAMLFAESGLVHKDNGVPLLMSRVNPEIKPIVLVLARPGEAVAPETADYVWYFVAQA